jgi:hypothetical protein
MLFYSPIRVAQHVITFAVENLDKPDDEQTYEFFLENDFAGKYDAPLGRYLSEEDLGDLTVVSMHVLRSVHLIHFLLV